MVIIGPRKGTFLELRYDNREAIYETITSIIDSAGKMIKDTFDSIGDALNTAEDGMKSVGNAITGFVNGLRTVFG